MKNKEITVLVTCVASQVMPNIIKHIKSYKDREIKIIGIDQKPKDLSIGSYFCDTFYQSPAGSNSKYISFIENIVNKHNISIIFPCSDEEVISLSSIRSKLLNTYRCVLISSENKETLLASNKFEMLNHIKKNGIPTPKYYSVDNIESLKQVVKVLGYPKNKVILKPKEGRGSKGLKIISSNISEYDRFISTGNFFISFEEVLNFFSKHKKALLDFIIMEYLPGDKYSSDILVENNKIKSIVTRNNWKTPKTSPPTQMADIVFDKDVIEYCEKICSVTDFNFFIQIETGRDKDGKIMYIETNPRLDATLPITLGLDINYYHEMITKSINGKYNKNLLKSKNGKNQIRFFRYWNETFNEV